MVFIILCVTDSEANEVKFEHRRARITQLDAGPVYFAITSVDI